MESIIKATTMATAVLVARATTSSSAITQSSVRPSISSTGGSKPVSTGTSRSSTASAGPATGAAKNAHPPQKSAFQRIGKYILIVFLIILVLLVLCCVACVLMRRKKKQSSSPLFAKNNPQGANGYNQNGDFPLQENGTMPAHGQPGEKKKLGIADAKNLIRMVKKDGH